ncbi:hypothetical protein BDP27DRAFT_1403598 [Rhodocollybia butyracea]|uniref:Uncharacterized protein n=1 Tax=Rhodocollybia butyracea TaxID=206335 RepID=A0A9P5PR54_9AGAR|nr:hypothetical protein BDP27DRAFT_1403598 [Rhodocollybia butyracea]
MRLVLPAIYCVTIQEDDGCRSLITMKFTGTVLAVASLLLVKASPAPSFVKRDQEVCPGQVTVSETFIGENSDVSFAHVFCPENEESKRALSARQIVDVCDDTCTTTCFTPSGGGPDPNDCHVIADAMRFFSQNENDTFTIGTGADNTVVLTYETCQTFYVNQITVEQSYCFHDWAAIVDFIAPNCQSTQNAHGGLCVADDGQWFIQVQTNTTAPTTQTTVTVVPTTAPTSVPSTSITISATTSATA